MIPPAKKFDLWAWLGCVALALAWRLPGLTVFLTADEARSWFGRSRIFFDALLRGDWANTAPGGQAPFIENVSLSPAPGVTTMWAGTLGMVLEYLRQGAPGSLLEFGRTIPFDPLDPAMLFTLRLPGVLLAALAVGLTYQWSRPFLGRRGAFLAAALLALDPFSLALSRVLGHDAFASTFMWLSLLALIRATIEGGRMKDEGGKNYFILHPSSFILSSGAFAGLACLSKYPALSIGLFTAATMLLTYLWQNKINGTRNTQRLSNVLGRWLKDMVGWSLAAAVVFVLLWPAMWVDPLGPVTTILNDALRASGGSHPKGSFFLGQPVPDPGWLFYPLVALFRTTPVGLVGIGLLLWQVVSRRMANGRSGEAMEQRQANPDSSRFTLHASLILLTYILFYTLLVTYGGKKQDRYLLPIFPPLTMLAAIGYLYASRLTPHASRITYHVSRITPHVSRISSLLPLIILIVQAAFVLPTYPYYFSFYNPLAGGGQTAARLMQVGWGEGLDEAAAFLNTLPNAETLKVVAWYSTTFEPYFKGHSIYEIDDEKISRSPKPGLAADYVVVYVNQVQRQLPSEGALQFFQASASPVYTVTLNGLDYAWIYPSLSLPHVLAGEARLVGQAELLGYRLSDEAGRPVTTAYPESVVLLSLYWEWQGQAEGDKLRLSLVDENNQTRGYGNPIETVAPVARAAWQDGMVVRDDFALVIFPDTPPGEYRLAAWIERPATGETVGVFPLEETFQIVPREAVAGGSGG
ncbi:MAG: glycosyltransferase family 39 protein [Anaerolineales bacterium]|nr:glycosyltransferase family 39 protein [Anaerolineales bacterium]